jgi:hypothetical protein
LVPTWDELALSIELLHSDEGIVIAKVDCTENKQVCGRFDVTGYPTLKYIADKKVYTYKGKRAFDELKEFVLSGYKEEKGEAVPPPPSWTEELISKNAFLKDLKGDFDHILDKRKNAALVLVLLGAAWGVMLTFLVKVLWSLGSTKKDKKD